MKGIKKNIFSGFLFTLIFAFLNVNAQSVSGKKEVTPALMHPPPIPYFLITGVCLGDTTYFYNRTDIGTIQWAITTDKGDTIYQDTKDTIAYYFKKRGSYNICLTADNGHLATKIRTLLVDTITKTDFSFRYCYDMFDNLSTCSDQYIWLLPDGSTSTSEFPDYTFYAPGTYTAKLVSMKGTKRDTTEKSFTINGDSIGMPTGKFTYKLVGSPDIFEFTALDSLGGYYAWNFGDQVFDDTSGYKVIHAIDRSVYDGYVQLFLYNDCGSAFHEEDPLNLSAIGEETKAKPGMVIFPNPVSDEVTIRIDNLPVHRSIVIKLLDGVGQVVREAQLSSIAAGVDYKLDMHSFAKGIYFLQVLDGRSFLVGSRIVKQ